MKRIVMQPGEVWGRLTVIREEGKRALCRCVCGTEGWFQRIHMRSGHTQSCGCYHRERMCISKNKTHGMSGRPTYVSWRSAKGRCTNPLDKCYAEYGGRGIFMCDRWINSFENFLSDMGEKPVGMTLERRDVNGPYSPDNCEWATPLDQTRNRRITISVEYNGISKTLGEWCDELGLVYMSAHQMIRNGKPAEYAFAKARRLGETGKRPNYNALITAETAAAILADTRPNFEIAIVYGVSQATVWNIKAGRSWRNSIERYMREAA